MIPEENKPEASSASRPGFVSDLKHMLRAFKHYNYRLFFIGQGISVIGTWMQMIAMSWLIYKLTGSAMLLGLVGFVTQIPCLVITPFAGVLIDRFDRRRILLWTQGLATLQAVILTIIVYTGVVQIWHIFALGLFIGLVNSVDMPTRQAFVIKMVDRREDLASAIAMNSAIFNGARLIGPLIAGFVIAGFGEKVCFLVNAVSFLAVIVSLALMRIDHARPEKGEVKVFAELKEGLSYTFRTPPIRSILLMLSFLSLTAMPYITIMPVMAKLVLSGDARTFGFLMGAIGVGALGGAVFLASRKAFIGLWKIIPIAACIFGTGLILFSFSRTLWISLFLMVVAGFGMMAQLATSNTVIQNIVDESKRGRVMAFYSTAMMGILPFGNLLVGGLADIITAPWTIFAGGVAAILASIVFSTRLGNFKGITQSPPAGTSPPRRSEIAVENRAQRATPPAK
ncbi:MAG: MFS transporter [bacterium]|nr:MFS transporter [bacterium]